MTECAPSAASENRRLRFAHYRLTSVAIISTPRGCASGSFRLPSPDVCRGTPLLTIDGRRPTRNKKHRWSGNPFSEGPPPGQAVGIQPQEQLPDRRSRSPRPASLATTIGSRSPPSAEAARPVCNLPLHQSRSPLVSEQPVEVPCLGSSTTAAEAPFSISRGFSTTRSRCDDTQLGSVG